MKIFNYEKKEKKLFGNELSSGHRALIRMLVKNGYTASQIKGFFEGGVYKEEEIKEKLPFIFNDNFEKYVKYIKRNRKIDDYLFIGTTCAILAGTAYLCYKIGENDGMQKLLDSDMYDKTSTSFIHLGKEKMLKEIITDAATKPNGSIIRGTIDKTGKFGYLVSKWVLDMPEGFNPDGPMVNVITGEDIL